MLFAKRTNTNAYFVRDLLLGEKVCRSLNSTTPLDSSLSSSTTCSLAPASLWFNQRVKVLCLADISCSAAAAISDTATRSS